MPMSTGGNAVGRPNAAPLATVGLLASGCCALLSAASMHSLARASDLKARLYEVITETGMPHLEENLRYTTTREQRCLAPTDLPSAFPILSHAALKGCRLDDEIREQDVIYYDLVCEGGNASRGSAVWQIGEHQISGVLNVKLGGKNLTFFQRVTGKPLGACPSS